VAAARRATVTRRRTVRTHVPRPREQETDTREEKVAVTLRTPAENPGSVTRTS